MCQLLLNTINLLKVAESNPLSTIHQNTGDFDLGQKVKILNFVIWNDESTDDKFFYIWKVVWKLKEDSTKRVKSREKNLNFFCLMHFYLGGKIFVHKKCLFYAKFFEFEMFSIEPFFCSSIQPQDTVKREDTQGLIFWLTQQLGLDLSDLPSFPLDANTHCYFKIFWL